MRRWPGLRLGCVGGLLDEAEAWLQEQLTDLPGYGGLRLEEDPPALILTFRSAEARAGAAVILRRHLAATGAPAGLGPLEERDEEDRDWVAASAATWRASTLGEGYAALPGDVPPVSGRKGIRVPVARAFGTGEHASTRLAAGLLEQQVRPGDAVLDVGTGTGLLAALAADAGAAALGIEIDPDAAAVAAATRRLNPGAFFHLACATPSALRPGASFRVVVANIERDPLLAMLPALADLCEPGGAVILAGLLVSQLEDLKGAAPGCGLVLQDEQCRDEWGALRFTPRPALRPRVLVPGLPATPGEVELPEEEAHHVRRVRRLRDGDPVELVDGRGHAWAGTLRGTGRRVTVSTSRMETRQVEPDVRLEVWQAVLHQAGRMEALVRTLTELGVVRFVPVISERCQGPAARRGDRRLRRAAEEALKQCGRLVLPEIAAATPLAGLLREADGEALSLVLDPCGRPLPEDAGTSRRPVRLLVGPEGGWSAAEIRAVQQAGFLPWRLGPRILRAETAALAAATLLLGAHGDLGGPGRPKRRI